MSDLRFTVPSTSDFDDRIWGTAYLTGIEGIPWFCRHTATGNEFSISRQIDESGKLHLVWPSTTVGNTCLETTSLRLGEDGYSLPVELARGTLHRLKTQTDEWQRVGLRLPNSYFEASECALDALLDALTSRDEAVRTRRSQFAIEWTLHAANLLVDSFSAQALDARRNSEGRLATLLGCQLPPTDQFAKLDTALQTAFNVVSVTADFGTIESTSGRSNFSIFDSQVDWATETDQKLCIGPLVDFRDGRLPDWLVLLDDGFDSVLEAACHHTAKTVERYKGKAHLWNCAAGINVPNRMRWNDEEVLRMAVSLIETVRRADERTPVLLSVDQPFSEYLRKEEQGISPLHFADALIRADLGLSGLALELNFDQHPGGTFPRDLMQVNQVIDRWSMLGLPLMVSLTAPTSSAPTSDRRCTAWETPELATISAGLSPDTPPDETPSWPRTGVHNPESIVRLLVSKPAVHAVIWNQMFDSLDSAGGSSGLWTKEGTAKPLLEGLAKLRKTALH
ncbi:MAG: hypothetical protein ACE361_07920 [Aureliella sp.]